MESKCYEYHWGRAWKNSNGQFHRENDLPAIEENSGTKIWFINGNRHRELGPAVITFYGGEFWFLNDIQYYPENMPIKLYIKYLKWEFKKLSKSIIK